MKISFSQIYPEIGVNYNISSVHLKAFKAKMEDIKLKLEFFEKKLKTDDFNLIFNISAKIQKESFSLVGPLVRKKQCTVEFTIFISHKIFKTEKESILFIFKALKLAIISIFNNYNSDLEDINMIAQIFDSEMEGLE